MLLSAVGYCGGTALLVPASVLLLFTGAGSPQALLITSASIGTFMPRPS